MTKLSGPLRNARYVAGSVFRPVESSAVAFTVGDNEIQLSMVDARALSEVLPHLLAEHSVALALAPLTSLHEAGVA